MSAPIICVVDDNAPLRASLCDLLHSAGYSSLAFTCAEDLLARVPERIDCVLTDIHMPGRDGIELLKALKAAKAPAPVIVMTADPNGAWRREALALGAEAFVEKPFEASALLRMVAECLGAGRPRV